MNIEQVVALDEYMEVLAEEEQLLGEARALKVEKMKSFLTGVAVVLGILVLLVAIQTTGTH